MEPSAEPVSPATIYSSKEVYALLDSSTINLTVHQLTTSASLHVQPISISQYLKATLLIVQMTGLNIMVILM
jgi:hypothetical protein